MKTNFTAKLFGLTLVTALTLTTLTACGNGGAAASSGTASGSALQSGDGGSVGTVLLSVNPEIEMDYDEVGNVVALTGLNEDGKAVLASYTGYEGKPCTTVVGELVDEINAGGYFDATIDGHEKNIVLKLERGSAYPNDQFLNELAEAVRLVVEADQIGSQTVALDSDDYDDTYGDKGYINAAAAQNILSTQLGRDDIQFVEKEYDLDDGEYEVEFVMDGVEYEYEVNAVTGKVTEMDAEYQDYDDTDYGPGSDGITDYGVTDYDDTDYGPNADGITDYDDTDYGPNADGVTDYDDTDYGPNADGVTDYDDTDYGPNADGVTDYNDTDYGPNADGVTDYDDTDYGPNNDGVTDYDDTDYGPNADGVTDYDDTDYGPNADGVTDYDDDDWYGDPTGSDYPGDSDDWDDDDDDDWDDDDDDDDDWDD